ncbi:PepSY-like domain-containing protein [Bacteroides sp. OttesenSCG-928-D19]|nr:PepSY-like domain-containing protein [Bacteroides sp. OttesenSCG-928-D19]
MKKLSFMMLAVFALGSILFISCEKSDDINPDQIYKEALQSKYPDATRAEWEKKKTYYVADCWSGKKDLEVWFNENAEWLMTETELARTELPTAITDALKATNYADWRIDDVDMLEYTNSSVVYVVEVEQKNKEIDLYFSPAGELLKEVDVTYSDDTHWPE